MRRPNFEAVFDVTNLIEGQLKGPFDLSTILVFIDLYLHLKLFLIPLSFLAAERRV